MKRSSIVPLVLVLVVAIGGLAGTLVAGWSPALGLDLQGGASVVLQPARKVSNEVLDQTIGIIRNRVDALGVAEPEIARQGDSIVVQLPGVKDQERALRIVGQTAELRFRPVLSEAPSEKQTAAAVAQAKNAVPSSTTVPGATTTVAGATATTKAPVTTTATTKAPATTAAPSVSDAPAHFGAFAVSAATPASTVVPKTVAVTPTPTTLSTATSIAVAPGANVVNLGDAAAQAQASTPSETTSIEDDLKTATVLLPLGSRTPDSPRFLLGPAELTGEVVSDAQAVIDNSNGQWQVEVTFNSKGSAAWDAMAGRYYQKQIAIVLDGIVKSAPTIQATQFNGRAVISGSFTPSEARDLATVLRFGSLPVQLKPATVQTVSATLGRDSLDAGLITGAIGLALVAIYMIAYYRTLGLVVLLGLSTSGALMWSLVSWLSESRGLALSLSGAVGIIVSVGITVDSYVVYFERTRDELRAGRSVGSAVQRGFKEAWRTILAADLTSLIGALVLYFLTVGSVRGFAFFLALSTLLDMIVAYFFTRPLVALLSRTRVLGGGGGPGVPAGGGRTAVSGSATRLVPSAASPSNTTSSTGGNA